MTIYNIPKVIVISWLAGSVLARPQESSTWRVGQGVKTSSGRVEGHASSLYHEVSEYLGIPFAKPPVGDLRFAAPKKLEGNGIIKAEKYSPDCPAVVGASPNSKISYASVLFTVGGIWGQAGSKQNEDCLTLNVWSKPQTGEKKKAVMVWIYGGGFNIGNSKNPLYDGSRLAEEQDVVVVSMNYRLNIFGFPRVSFLPDINLGLLDQRLAIEWVRDNIEAFGGDPKRIMLFGESAGAGSVDMYSYAWVKDPIAHAFVAESGAAFIGSGPVKNASEGWWLVSKHLGCGGEESGEKSLPCMRSKKSEDIVDAMKKTGTGGMMSHFGPLADEKVVFSDYGKRLAEGNFIKAPLLIGNNDDEGGLTTALEKLPKSPNPVHRKEKRQSVPSLPKELGCVSAPTAAGRIKNGVPAWRYLFKGVFPNTDIGSKGAYHTAEIPLVFGTTASFSHKADTAVEKELVSQMMKAWATFAKQPKDGLSKVMGWPVYDAEKETLISLGGKNSSKVQFVSRKVNDDGCPRKP